MNDFTKKEKRMERCGKREEPASKPWVFPLIIWGGLLLAMIFSTHVVRVYFNDRKEKLENEALQLRLQIRQTDLEIKNLKVELQRLSSFKYIRKRIQDYNLALRPTMPEQIRYLKYYDSMSSEYGRPQKYSVAAVKEDIETELYQASVRP